MHVSGDEHSFRVEFGSAPKEETPVPSLYGGIVRARSPKPPVVSWREGPGAAEFMFHEGERFRFRLDSMRKWLDDDRFDGHARAFDSLAREFAATRDGRFTRSYGPKLDSLMRLIEAELDTARPAARRQREP
jgi:hypothetical protein